MEGMALYQFKDTTGCLGLMQSKAGLLRVTLVLAGFFVAVLSVVRRMGGVEPSARPSLCNCVRPSQSLAVSVDEYWWVIKSRVSDQ